MRSAWITVPLLSAALLCAWAEPLAPGAAAPEIKAGGWLNGEAPKADDLKGKILVVDFWAYS